MSYGGMSRNSLLMTNALNSQWGQSSHVAEIGLCRKLIGILLPKLVWPTVRKKNVKNGEKLLKFEAEGQKFAKILRSLEQFIHTVKGQNNFC